MSKTPLQIDTIPVDNEEHATLLMVHHLALAALLFEIIREDGNHTLNAVIDRQLGHCEPHRLAARTFGISLLHSYNKLGKEIDDDADDE